MRDVIMNIQQLRNVVGDFSTSKLPKQDQNLVYFSADRTIPTTSQEGIHRMQICPNSTSNHLGASGGNEDFERGGTKKQPRYKRYMKHDKKQRMFSCEHCDERFTVRANMKRHMSVHTGRKDYKCQFCDYKCSRNDALTSHLRVHFGSSRYTCGSCGYKFRTSTTLMNHEQACKRKMMFNSIIGQSAASGGGMTSNHLLPFSLTNNHNNQAIQFSSNPKKMTSFGSSLFAPQHPTTVDGASKNFRFTDSHTAGGSDTQKNSSSLTVMGENKRAHSEQIPLDLRVLKLDQGSMNDMQVTTNPRFSFVQDNQLPERSEQHQNNDIQTLVVHSDKNRQESGRGDYFYNFKSYRGSTSGSSDKSADAYNQRNTVSNFSNIQRNYGRAPAQRQYFGVTPRNMSGNSRHSAQRSLTQADSSGIIDTPQQSRQHYNEDIRSLVPAIDHAYKQVNMHRMMYLQSSRRLYQLASLARTHYSTQPALLRGNSIEDQEDSENE